MVKISKFFICPGWLDALAFFFFFSVDYNSVEIGTDTNISEKCLAGLLYIKGEKKEPACVFFSIIH